MFLEALIEGMRPQARPLPKTWRSPLWFGAGPGQHALAHVHSLN